MLDHEIKLDFLKAEIEKVLLEDPFAKEILQFFRSRKRSAENSDINQITVYIKKSQAPQITSANIRTILNIFEEAGIGQIIKEEKRHKFIWKYWIFPFFDKANSCRGIKIVKMSEFKSDTFLFGKTLKAVEDIEDQIDKGTFGATKNDILFFNGSPPNPLSKYTLEELVAEIDRRGFIVNFTIKK